MGTSLFQILMQEEEITPLAGLTETKGPEGFDFGTTHTAARYLLIEEFAGLLFDWVQILDLSCRESHNERDALRRSGVLVEVVARWLGAFVDSLVYGLAEVHSLQEKIKAGGKRVRNVRPYTRLME